MFEYADKAIRDMNRRNIKSFRRLRQLKFDELNILGEVTDVYDKIARVARKWYLEIARHAYIAALIALGESEREAKEAASEEITEDYIIEMLDEYDPVTLYQFMPELERKKQRLIEALIASHNKNSEIDKALRYLTLQLSQYADKAELEATIQAYKDAGIEKVRWVTQEDEKVCGTCAPRDGKVYDIDKVPPRPHYRCRCELEPIKGKKGVEKSENDGIIKSEESLHKGNSVDRPFKPVGRNRIMKLTASVRKNGAEVTVGGDETYRYLNKREATAITIGNHILLRDDACISEVLEEMRHFEQSQLGMFLEYSDPLYTWYREAEARSWIIENASKYNVPRAELDYIKSQYSDLQQQINNYIEGR